MNVRVKRFEMYCPCGNVVLVKESQIGRKKFCSCECKYRFYKKSTGFKRVDKTPNPNWFKQNHSPWNTGTIGATGANSGSIKDGEHRSLSTEFTSESSTGENNKKWKGDNVGYYALHRWVRRTLGIPTRCSRCGGTAKRLDWANVSREYKREKDDWIALCSTCHGKFDTGNRGAIKRRFQCV